MKKIGAILLFLVIVAVFSFLAYYISKSYYHGETAIKVLLIIVHIGLILGIFVAIKVSKKKSHLDYSNLKKRKPTKVQQQNLRARQ